MKREAIFRMITYAACICALIWPALYNGYPILYSDSASYIVSGMKLETPADRPITYGLFIWITSIGGSTLWTVIACQAAIAVRLLELLLLRVRKPDQYHNTILFCSILALAFLTSLPWVVSQVMADIYTSMLVITTILLFLPGEIPRRRYERPLLYVLFFFCVAAHLSHPLFVVILLFFLFLFRVVLHRWTTLRTSIGPLWTMLLLAVLAYPIMSSAIAKSGNILFMGAMAEHGVAKAYLDEHCAQQAFKVCAWKDRFPERAYQFHWDPAGPMGAYSGWPEANAEFGKIIGATLIDPKYIGIHVRASLAATWKQLGMFAIGDGWGPFREGSGVYLMISKYMRHDLSTMEASLQYQGRMGWILPFVTLHAWVQRIALLALLPLLFLAVRKQFDPVLPIAIVLVMGIVLSAWGSGTFSGEVDRFGCKMIWMLPLLAMLATISLFQARNTLMENGS